MKVVSVFRIEVSRGGEIHEISINLSNHEKRKSEKDLTVTQPKRSRVLARTSASFEGFTLAAEYNTTDCSTVNNRLVLMKLLTFKRPRLEVIISKRN